MVKIHLTRRAEKQIKALPGTVRNRVLGKLKALQRNPLSGDIKKLKVKQSRYRLRVGDYRIIYDIEKESAICMILTVRHRKDVYR
ncbi:MAG: type II toxin-antitoxin system RelE/ParE family toxin [Candidatus Marinimicrobia bacterium]|nr:type II toxin-antitoxin system RelE/ParE family toxin [Candidatus Neomarinimicrobiota bacterium]